MHGICKTYAAEPAAKHTAPMLGGSARCGDDAALLTDIADGSAAAMETLYRRFSIFVFRYIVGLVGDASLAEDVASDVFVDVWRQAGQFEGRSRVSTWIMAIARFKAMSALRRRVHSHCDVEEAGSELIAADEMIDRNGGASNDDPEHELVNKEERMQMKVCVARLSDKHRQIIDLLYYQEKTIDEIAALVHTSRSTVKARAFYARRQLARLMEPGKSAPPPVISKAA